MHVDYINGMFVKSAMPRFVAPHCSGSCFLSTRTDVLLVVKMKARSYHVLDPSFSAALQSLPDVYDENDTLAWDNFFSVYPSFFTESALIGGKIEISSDTQNMDDKDIKGVLDELLHRGEAGDAQKLMQNSKDRVSVQGGDSMVLGGSVKGFSHAKHTQWVESLKRSPVVVGYNIRPVSDLVDFNAKSKEALQKAIEAHLQKGYAVWRRQVVIHDEIVNLMEGAKDSLHDEVKTLEQKKEEVAKRLAHQKSLIEDCEKEGEKLDTIQKRCKSEVLAYQKRLIDCDTENMKGEKVFDLLYSCNAKKKISGCDLTSKKGKGEKQQHRPGKRRLR